MSLFIPNALTAVILMVSCQGFAQSLDKEIPQQSLINISSNNQKTSHLEKFTPGFQNEAPARDELLFTDDFHQFPGDWEVGDADARNGRDYWGHDQQGRLVVCPNRPDDGRGFYDDNQNAYMFQPIDLRDYHDCSILISLAWSYETERNRDRIFFQVRGLQGDWAVIQEGTGDSNGPEEFDERDGSALDLSDYAGQRVEIGFFFRSDERNHDYGSVRLYFIEITAGEPSARISGIDDDIVHFGLVRKNTNCNNEDLYLVNDGGALVVVRPLEIVGNDARFFHIDSPRDWFAIERSDSVNIRLVFSPDDRRVFRATLQIRSNGGEWDITLVGQGGGPHLVIRGIQNNTIDFGGVPIESVDGNDSMHQHADSLRRNWDLTLVNDGEDTLTVQPLQIVGNDARYFTIVSPQGLFVIPPQDSQHVELNFHPTERRRYQATLQIRSDGGDFDINLIGQGVGPQLTIRGIRDDVVDFGLVRIDSRVENSDLTLANVGDWVMTVQPMQIIGNDARYFTIVSPQAEFTIQAGQSQNIVLSFRPTERRQYQATLQLRSDGGNRDIGNRDILLIGQGGGPSLVLLPEGIQNGGINFGGRRIGQDHELRTVSMTNSGEIVLTVQPLQIVGVDSAFFSVVSPQEQFQIQPRGWVEIVIRFTPQERREYHATLLIRSDGGDWAIPLHGMGGAPHIGEGGHQNPSVNFGSVNSGQTHVDSGLVIANDGEFFMTVQPLQIVGGDTGIFTIIQPQGQFTIPAGEMRRIILSFQPTEPRHYQDTLQIRTDGGNLDILLIGDGRASGVEELKNLTPLKFALSDAFPNPFNSTTHLQFDMPKSGHAKVSIFGMDGREVTRLVDGFEQAGRHEVAWNATGIASGVYLISFQSGSTTLMSRAMLLR